jgi:hypothetical protein
MTDGASAIKEALHNLGLNLIAATAELSTAKGL